jgi:arsenate reductase-like glutaredoxin family protein
VKAWLSQQKAAFDVKDLLTQPPSRAELAAYSRQVPGGVRGMVTTNTAMPDYVTHLGGKEKEMPEEKLLDLLAKVPNLLRKPILTDGPRVLQGVSDAAALEAFVKGAAK